MNIKQYLRYVFAKVSQYLEEKSYKIYVTDALKGLIEVTGRCKVSYRWHDLYEPPEVDTRTTAEVTNDIIAGLEKILGKEEDE